MENSTNFFFFFLNPSLSVQFHIRAPETCEYFGYIAELVAEMIIGDKVTASTVKNLTNKTVYAEMTSTSPPPYGGDGK